MHCRVWTSSRSEEDPEGLTEVRLPDSTSRSGEPATVGKRAAEVELFVGNMSSIQREDSVFYAKRKISQS